MSHFKFTILISISILFWACDEKSTGPSEEIPTKNPLIGKWQEQLDTSTSEGKTGYKARTFLGNPWIADTMNFKNDSIYFHTTTNTDIKYQLKEDTLIAWNPLADYDTSRTFFEVRHDTLYIGGHVIAGNPYYKKLL